MSLSRLQLGAAADERRWRRLMDLCSATGGASPDSCRPVSVQPGSAARPSVRVQNPVHAGSRTPMGSHRSPCSPKSDHRSS